MNEPSSGLTRRSLETRTEDSVEKHAVGGRRIEQAVTGLERNVPTHENVGLGIPCSRQEGSNGSSPRFEGAESDQSIGAVVSAANDGRDRPVGPVFPHPVRQFPSSGLNEGAFRSDTTLHGAPIESSHLGGRRHPYLQSASSPGSRSKYHGRICPGRSDPAGVRPADMAT